LAGQLIYKLLLYEYLTSITAFKARGRPKLRRFDDVREELRILKVKDWRSIAMDRDAWRLLVQESQTHKGL
jgi:hypothetical protein